ncbi:zf-HC2 domain-containing protein [Desulfurivibrio dismutans]|uniref:zf-HC2 domain-containing protein n=1 Tax=Desulfurivibrio dismutans TaxID=1398908 RepID=UPI0023DCC492|nr:zf-HC2 domain-containing protein [Desulfurivibrio alkaliphilus]MDF1613414.1 zf-HC2 domain-containing protein [Desulfurivibrio alkaliphilus]
MDCAQLPSLYTARLDQELTQEEQAAFDGHLVACADCARQWRLFQATMDRLYDLEPLPAPPDLLPGIMAAVERRKAFAPTWLARLLAWWQRQDFSVSVPTAAGTVATAMLLAVLVKNSMIPWPLAAPLEAPVTDSQPRASQVAGLVGDSPRLPLPDATLAATSPRRYQAPIVAPDFTPGHTYDTVPSHRSSLPGLNMQRPDVLVVFEVNQGDDLDSFLADCNSQSSWRVGYPGRDMMLLELPPCELPRLRELLAGKSAAIAPVAALSPDFAQDLESVKVAIRFRQPE